ncbi:hypothetical protein HED34_07200 [Vagococcus fluvialis]|uniref:lipopolysaccharide biosynthesis protein n=1 Tax=Vagococcus fluvialis TaxID=2738 RepID=UPI00143339BB|nr:hypothetical protein [Vagococcus fluvialis]NKC59752.1 hypothetical protein [Vagococcus fluvialis]NKD50649.1 hypothetical protein [Vagococcus fluvialis]
MSRIRALFKNISYSLFSNGLNLLISLLLVLFVPKILGITSYSYWQLYVFYTSFSGFMNIGWVEGLYLKLGGENIKTLDKSDVSSQFYIFLIYSLLISGILYTGGSLFLINPDEKFVFQMFSIATFFTITRGFLQFIFQSIDEIKKYSKTLLLDRIIYSLIVVALLSLGYQNYKGLIIIDIFTKVIGFFYTIYLAQDILIKDIIINRNTFLRIKDNIKIGLNLLLSNIASQLIIGITRIMIKNNWSIEVFGKVSLSLSLTSFFMIFINAIGIVIFPFLKKYSEEEYPSIYKKSYELLTTLLLGILIFYYPVNILIKFWLPEYFDSIEYMIFLLPMCIYESLNLIITNSFLKALRQERKMLIINVSSLLVSVIFNVVAVYIFDDLKIVLFGLLLSIVFKSTYSDFFLRKKMSMNFSVYNSIRTFLVVIIFIILNLNLSNGISFLLYLIILIIIGLKNKKSIKLTILGSE